jgi:phosphoribosylglycinamide formyltransferase-1
VPLISPRRGNSRRLTPTIDELAGPGRAVNVRVQVCEQRSSRSVVAARYDVDLVALLGFLSLFQLRGKFEGRTRNVHPSLIPAFCGVGFYGDRVHKAVLASGVRVSGAPVHFLNEQYDEGPIILQEAVPVLEHDTPDTLAARVIRAERRLVPEAIRLFSEGRLQIEDNRVRIARAPR